LQISDPTVGVDFFSRQIQVRNGTRIKLQLWDVIMHWILIKLYYESVRIWIIITNYFKFMLHADSRAGKIQVNKFHREEAKKTGHAL